MPVRPDVAVATPTELASGRGPWAPSEPLGGPERAGIAAVAERLAAHFERPLSLYT